MLMFSQWEVSNSVAFESASSEIITAATAILYAAEDPSVAGMVLDSPFADLVQLCEEVAQMAPVKVRLLSIFSSLYKAIARCPRGC
jgi:hypothetical protein